MAKTPNPYDASANSAEREAWSDGYSHGEDAGEVGWSSATEDLRKGRKARHSWSIMPQLMVDRDSLAEYAIEAAHESHDNMTCFSPWEFRAKAYNDFGDGGWHWSEDLSWCGPFDSEDAARADLINEGFNPDNCAIADRPSSDQMWDAYNNGVAAGIGDYIARQMAQWSAEADLPCTVSWSAHSGCGRPAESCENIGEAREIAARWISEARDAGHLVSIETIGAAWEVTQSDDDGMVSDLAGRIEIEMCDEMDPPAITRKGKVAA